MVAIARVCADGARRCTMAHSRRAVNAIDGAGEAGPSTRAAWHACPPTVVVAAAAAAAAAAPSVPSAARARNAQRHVSTTCPARSPPNTSAEQQMDLGRHFYLNKVLEQYAAKPATRMTLRQLVFFGRTLGRDRDKILKSANYVRQELAVRIAHRIRDLQALPFVVMTNPHLEEVYEKYWQAFETFRRIPMIRTMDDNDSFCSTLKSLLDDHLTIIPSLTIGIVESAQHLSSEHLDGFMERMLRSRISRRVLAEQHIALSEALDDPFHFFNEASHSSTDSDAKNDGDHIGIIYTGLKVSSAIEKVVRLLKGIFEEEVRQGLRAGDAAIIPDVIVDGALETRFAYIPEHLEYIFFELIKNSMTAVMRQHMALRDPVCIRATIVEGPPDEDLIVRVSDCGGGLPDILTKVQPHARREHRRRHANRAAPRRRLETLGDESASLYGRSSAVENEAAARTRSAQSTHTPSGLSENDATNVTMDATLSDDSSSYLASILETEAPREIDIAMSHAKHSVAPPPKDATSIGTGATANRAGQADPIVAAVTSFSSVRRRLELEEEEVRRQQRRQEIKSDTESKGSGHDYGVAGVSSMDAPASATDASNGTIIAERAEAKMQTRRASSAGIDSLAKMEALRRVGRFKGTVSEQLISGRDASRTHLQAVSDAAIASAASNGAPERETRSAASALIAAGARQETGLGLPMTKIYTDFFGGSLSLRSLDGHGMDVYVRLPKLGTHKEAIEEIVL